MEVNERAKVLQRYLERLERRKERLDEPVYHVKSNGGKAGRYLVRLANTNFRENDMVVQLTYSKG